MSITDNPAIVGAGTTSEYGVLSDQTRLGISAEALKNAIEDAGITKDQIDGLTTNYAPPIATYYDRLCEALGLDVRFVDQKQHMGRFVGNSVRHAALAVEAGLADYVAAGMGLKWNAVSQVGGEVDQNLTDLGSVHSMYPRPWYGFTGPVAASAMHTRYYMEKYGATSEDLAHVAKTLRDHASLDPRSHYSEPYTIEEHQDSRWIVEPLHLFDCAAQSDGGAYLIITSSENAESFDNPAYITGMEGLHAGRDDFIGGGAARRGMGIRTQREYDYDPAELDYVYESSGVTRDDIDALFIYDAFSANIWFGLERWGFCDTGEAFEYTRDGRIGIDGELPINTHGGHLSNGHLSGWNHMVEMYNQIQGRCDERQIGGADTVQWATPWGDSVILQRD